MTRRRAIIRSDYCVQLLPWNSFPAPYDSPRPLRSSAARRSSRRCGRSFRARRRSAVGSRWWAARPARARAASCGSWRTGSPAKGVLVLYGACDAVVHTPYRPFAEALDQLVREHRPRRAPCGPRQRGRRAGPAASRPGRSRQRAARARRRRSRHRAPSSAHGGDRPARGRRSPPAAAARARGLPLGGHAHARATAPPRSCEQRGPRARAGDVPRHRGRRSGRARRRARRPAPLRRRRAPPPGRPQRGRRRGVRAASRRRRDRSRRARALPRAARSHRGQRLPALRALAGARRDRRSRDRRRHPPADCDPCRRSRRLRACARSSASA